MSYSIDSQGEQEANYEAGTDIVKLQGGQETSYKADIDTVEPLVNANAVPDETYEEEFDRYANRLFPHQTTYSVAGLRSCRERMLLKKI